MKKLATLLAMLCTLLAFTACVDEEEYDDTPAGNFDALWHILDDHYCFFDEKQTDWNAIYNKYKVRIDNRMTDSQLFEVMSDMLSELRDGHVNLARSADFARYWSFYENYPTNFSDTLLRRYLGTDYHIAAGLRYRILDDNTGYIYYESFTDAIGESGIDDVLSHLMLCRGLIIDVRNNGGGTLTNAELFAGRFVQSPTLVGYMQHKTGPGHADFSPLSEQRLEPSSRLRWHKPVVVLTNRRVYSAANEFVKYMHRLPGVTLLGDRTGGGAGLPFMSSLPNGWSIRFSACPMYDAEGRSVEFGIDPDIHVAQSDADFLRGEDTLIETARKLLAQ